MISFRFLLTATATFSLAGLLFANDSPAFTIVEEGVPRCVILLSDDASASDQDAATELNYWVNAITGASLEIVNSSQWDEKQPYIAIGESNATRKNGWKVEDLSIEGARVIIEPGRIGLLGSRQLPEGKLPWPQSFEALQGKLTPKSPQKGTTGPGSYYAALELIQKKFGVRWIWPGKLGEVYSRSKTLRVEPGTWKWEPSGSLLRNMRDGYAPFASEYRKVFGTAVDPEKLKAITKDYDMWRKRQRMNSPEPISTGLTFMYWWSKYHEKHPDWFAQAPEGRKALARGLAKLNLSNPEVVDQVVKDWQEGQQSNPNLRYYLNIAPNDLKGFDVRKETRALDAPEMQVLSDEEIWSSDKPVLSDRHLYFWNAIAKKIAVINPDTKLVTLAYDRYRKPPLMKGKVADSLIIGFVGGEGYYPDEPDTLKEYLGWRGLGANLYWRPNAFHGGHGIPYLYSERLYHDVSTMIENGLLGTDYDSMTGYWATQGLNYYVGAEVQNRPTASYQTLANEYFQSFGKAAAPIAEYHAYFEKLTAEKAPLLRDKKMVENESWGKFWRGHMRFVAVVFTDDVLQKGDELLKQAEAAVADASPEEKARVAFVREGFDHTRLMAQTFRSIGLDHPDQPLNLDYQKLEPLWKARQKNLLSLAYNSTVLFGHEQIQFNIWSDFIHNSRLVDENVTHTPLIEAWQTAAIPEGDNSWRGETSTAKWASFKKSEKKEPEANAGREIVYRRKFDMPQLLDHRQYATLRIDGIKGELLIWINGRRIPIGQYKALKGSAIDSANIVINIIDFVEQAKPVTLEVKADSHSGRIGFADAVYLLTISHD